MPGIDPSVVCHQLSLNPMSKSVMQRKRKNVEEKTKAITEEVGKLLKVGFMQEIKYPTWLSNMVMVIKKSGNGMCVDFTDLNKACPKDLYSLPHIDRLIDVASGFHLLSFMNSYSSYNQIRMSPTKPPKMVFMTDINNFYYKVMPFWLKTVMVTY